MQLYLKDRKMYTIFFTLNEFDLSANEIVIIEFSIFSQLKIVFFFSFIKIYISNMLM